MKLSLDNFTRSFATLELAGQETFPDDSMGMQLFILGPAFGLPSIDAECLAAATLLKLHFADETDEWSIVPTHHRTQRLPCLRLHDSTTIHGFRSISLYLQKNAKQSLSPKEQADATALLSFLSCNAQPLLDISLYVAFENYTTTRSAFTRILPWHANYILPPSLRAAARTRTAHLGIASLDVDDVHEDLSNRSAAGFEVGREGEGGFEVAAQKRASLLLGGGRASLRGLLQRPEHVAAFKLNALAENCFAPLEEWLSGETPFFLGRDEPGKVDCAVYGWLALMLYPSLPQDWLSKTLKQKYTRLTKFVERMHHHLDMKTDVEAIMALAKCQSNQEVRQMRKSLSLALPWDKPATTTPVQIAGAIVRDLCLRVPVIGSSITIIPASPTKVPQWQQQLPVVLGAAATCLGLFGYYAFSTGMLIWPHGEEIHVFGKRRLSDYGHLGAALAGVSLLRQQVVGTDAAYHDPPYQSATPSENAVLAEVKVEQEG